MTCTINAPYVFQENYLCLFVRVFCITNKKPKWSSTPATADSGWTLARCCTDLTPCCCFLPFLAPLPPCSHSFTLVLVLASTKSLDELVQLSNPAENKLVSAELSLISTRLSWLTEGLTGTRIQGRLSRTTVSSGEFTQPTLGSLHKKPKPSMYGQVIIAHVTFQQNSQNLERKHLLKK